MKIEGNTYPVRDQLKALGARWNAAGKYWEISADKAAQANKIVAGAGQAPKFGGQVSRRKQHRPRGSADSAPKPQAPMTAVTDIPAEAAKHSRKEALAETAKFLRGSSKSDATQIGQSFWGKHRGARYRFLIIRETEPYFLSQDWLEDMDDFTTAPGWYRDVMAIAVEPTAEEIANDPAVAKAKAEALSKRRREITQAVQRAPQDCADTRMNDHIAKHPTTGMQRAWGEVRMGGSELMFTDGSKLIYVTSSYDDGLAVWALTDAALAAEALALKTDAKI